MNWHHLQFTPRTGNWQEARCQPRHHSRLDCIRVRPALPATCAKCNGYFRLSSGRKPDTEYFCGCQTWLCLYNHSPPARFFVCRFYVWGVVYRFYICWHVCRTRVLVIVFKLFGGWRDPPSRGGLRGTRPAPAVESGRGNETNPSPPSRGRTPVADVPSRRRLIVDAPRAGAARGQAAWRPSAAARPAPNEWAAPPPPPLRR